MKAIRVIYGLGVGGLIYLLISTFLYLCFKGYHGHDLGNIIFCISYVLGLALVVCSLLFKSKLRAVSLGLLTGGLLMLLKPLGLMELLFRYLYSYDYYYDYSGIGMWWVNRGLMLGGIIVALGVIIFLGYKKLGPLNGDAAVIEAESINNKGGSGMTALRVVYGLGIGLMITMLVGFAIAAFYQPPHYGDMAGYGRNIALIVGFLGLALAISGMLLMSRINAIKIGLLLGGLLLLVGGIVFTCVAVGVTWAFAATFIVLAILIVTGYFGLASKRRADTGE
jgi:hypothetical protein